MQLHTNIKQLGFREYKLILEKGQLAGTDEDKDKVMNILASQIDNQKITLKKPEEKKN